MTKHHQRSIPLDVALYTEIQAYADEHSTSQEAVIATMWTLYREKPFAELHPPDTLMAYQAMETALLLLTGNILNMRTELLAVKSLVQEQEQEQESEHQL